MEIYLSSNKELLKITEELIRLRSENKIAHWEPTEKQKKFLYSKSHKKALIAANQSGKTSTLLYELALHLTGRYPFDWKGIRFNTPPDVWLCGVTHEKVRDNLQNSLVGDVGKLGTGFIPKQCIIEDSIIRKPGIPNSIHKMSIKHTSGGISTITFFSYQQGREDFQSSTINIVAFDEEPKQDIYNECKMRVIVKKGYLMFAFTPLSEDVRVCKELLNDENADLTSISMDDCPWLTEEMIDSLLQGMSDSEKNARRHGIPASAGGLIFQFEPYEYSCDSFEIPSYWKRLGGLDIGYNHPTGAIALAYDQDNDTVYIYQEYREVGKQASEVARYIKKWGCSFAISHDAFNKTFAKGECVADIFKEEGLEVFSAGKEPWARIEKTRRMIAESRLFIFKDKCPRLMSELLTYHTKQSNIGKEVIYKKDEDLVDAFTHAVFFYEKALQLNHRRRDEGRYVEVKEWKPFDKKLGV